METQSIVILDFGSQYTQLIARRIRELNVFSVVLPCTASLAEVQNTSPAGIILSGGPCSVYDADAPPATSRVLHLGVPVLGICYGLHFMTHQLGGKVVPAPTNASTATPQVDMLNANSALFDGSAQARSQSGCRTATKPWNCLPASAHRQNARTPSPPSPTRQKPHLGGAVPS